MLNDKKVVAIIPARAGSKRIKKKNTVELGGKPLIQWTIEASQKSIFIDNLIVSTDDKDIIDLCYKLNIAYIERPSELSKDDTPTTDVLIHMIEALKLEQEYDYMILLQPTSPFRSSTHIDEAFVELQNKSASSIISVTPCIHPPQWSNTIPPDGNMGSFLRTEFIGKRSQDFDISYNLNGAIFIAKIEEFRKNKTFFIKNNSYAYVMPRNSSIDIDVYEDLEYAKFLCKNLE